MMSGSNDESAAKGSGASEDCWGPGWVLHWKPLLRKLRALLSKSCFTRPFYTSRCCWNVETMTYSEDRGAHVAAIIVYWDLGCMVHSSTFSIQTGRLFIWKVKVTMAPNSQGSMRKKWIVWIGVHLIMFVLNSTYIGHGPHLTLQRSYYAWKQDGEEAGEGLVLRLQDERVCAVHWT